MIDKEKDLLLRMQQITGIFVKNNVNCAIALDGETAVFDVSEMNVPYKEALMEAGATYDISRNKWIFWYEE